VGVGRGGLLIILGGVVGAGVGVGVGFLLPPVAPCARASAKPPLKTNASQTPINLFRSFINRPSQCSWQIDALTPVPANGERLVN
jgi:hypothetical protein